MAVSDRVNIARFTAVVRKFNAIGSQQNQNITSYDGSVNLNACTAKTDPICLPLNYSAPLWRSFATAQVMLQAADLISRSSVHPTARRAQSKYQIAPFTGQLSGLYS